LSRRAVRGELSALNDGVEAGLLGIAKAGGEVGEGLAVVEIWGMHDVAGRAEVTGERETPRRQSLRMMEQQQLSRAYSVA